MCRMASYLWKKSESLGVEVNVYDLTSHSKTQERLKLTEKAGWYEGHYTPQSKIECRTPEGKDADAAEEIKRRYPAFHDFLVWACNTQDVVISEDCDLSGCDLKGVKFPDTMGGWLDLRGCQNIPAKLPMVKDQIYR